MPRDALADPPTGLHIPRGRLVRSRVVPDVRTVLVDALDRDLTGYVVVEPQSALLLGDDGAGVMTFEDGVPVLAYHTGTDEGGATGLAAFAGTGPCHVDCYELDASALAEAHDTPELQVPAGMPAERLAGDPALADRTRERAPDDRQAPTEPDAVVAFLDDADRIEAIRREARDEARRRAEEWGLDDHLSD